LATEAFDLGDRHSDESGLLKTRFHLFESERLDDGFNSFH